MEEWGANNGTKTFVGGPFNGMYLDHNFMCCPFQQQYKLDFVDAMGVPLKVGDIKLHVVG